MLRRFLALLIAIAYFAGQLAAVPHSHAMTPAGHAMRAHLHAQVITTSHDHGHSHPHDHARPPSHQLPAQDDATPADHDDDCIYLPDSVTPAMQAKVQLPD